MPEQVPQHVRRDSLVGVPLGVTVPVGVRDDREPVEDLLSGLAVVAGHRGDELAGDGVDPLAVRAGEGSLVVGPGPRGVRVVTREQWKVTGGRGGEPCPDVGLLAGDDSRGFLGDRQPPARPVVLGVGVDEHRLALGVTADAVEPQLADLVGPPPGVDHQLGHPAHVGAAAFGQDGQASVEDLHHPGGQVPALLIGIGLGRDVVTSHDEVVGQPAGGAAGAGQPMARMSATNRRSALLQCSLVCSLTWPVRCWWASRLVSSVMSRRPSVPGSSP
jgi:hypothetical protein